jgi:hypothetical protein
MIDMAVVIVVRISSAAFTGRVRLCGLIVGFAAVCIVVDAVGGRPHVQIGVSKIESGCTGHASRGRSSVKTGTVIVEYRGHTQYRRVTQCYS